MTRKVVAGCKSCNGVRGEVGGLFEIWMRGGS